MLSKFTSKLEKSPNKGGWTYAIWPDAGEALGTRGAVKVRGTIDGHEFAATVMPMGRGVQMLPVKASLRAAISKQAGDTVEIVIAERL